MKKTCIQITKLLLILIVSFCSYALKTGTLAPDFTLEDSSGKKQSLDDYKGKIVVLEWTNYDCPFVKKHYLSKNMQKLQKKFTEKGIVWFSICSSAPGKQGYFKPEVINQRKKELQSNPTAYLIDKDGQVGKAYGAKTTPHIFIIDSKGILVYQGAIDSITSMDPKDIPEASNYVQSALEALLEGKPIAANTTSPYGCSVKY